jgi:hypothetical protein
MRLRQRDSRAGKVASIRADRILIADIIKNELVRRSKLGHYSGRFSTSTTPPINRKRLVDANIMFFLLHNRRTT